MDLGKSLKKLRRDKGITQKVLCEALGIRTNTYSQYENNVRFPSYDILEKIVKYFNVDYNFVLGSAIYDDELLDKIVKYFTYYIENKKLITELNRHYARALDDPSEGVTKEIKIELDRLYEKHFEYVRFLIDILMEEGFKKDVYGFDRLDKKIMTGQGLEDLWKDNE